MNDSNSSNLYTTCPTPIRTNIAALFSFYHSLSYCLLIHCRRYNKYTRKLEDKKLV